MLETVDETIEKLCGFIQEGLESDLTANDCGNLPDLIKALLLQVGYKVLGKKIKEKMYEYRRGTGKKTTRIIECTKAEALRIRIEHEFYCNLWKEEQDFLFECFIQKHRIFTSNDEEKNGEGKKLTMAEKIRMNAAMKAMQDKSMTQRIEG